MDGEYLQLEEFLVAVAVGLPLHGLDLVVGAFQRAGGDAVVIPGQEAGAVELQGLGELLRCVQCLRDGEWTARMHDVEELEKQILAEAARKQAAQGASS